MKKQPTKIQTFKMTDGNMQCNGFQYEIGKTYTFAGEIEICERGFHSCQKAQNCLSYYNNDGKNRLFRCEVEITGKEQFQDGDINEFEKICSDNITFLEELTDRAHIYFNSGNSNSGNSNSGNSNSGNWNSGNSNSGNSNSGNSNSGNSNSGNWNSGDSNSGDSNSGNCNSGDRNSGDSNSGNSNSGYSNSGYSNSGNWNSGDRNSGDSNSGYRNSGAFCTEPNPYLVLFDKPTKILIKDWEQSEVMQVMNNHLNFTFWVWESEMTAKEKEDYPSYKTTGGYLKNISVHEGWANMWGNLSDHNKSLFLNLPNFDHEKFESITGIKTK